MSVTITLEAERLKCPNCNELVDLDDTPMLDGYQCVECEEWLGDDRRCPECNRFARRAKACPQCEEVVEDDPDGLMVPVITCGCHDEEHEVNV